MVGLQQMSSVRVGVAVRAADDVPELITEGSYLSSILRIHVVLSCRHDQHSVLEFPSPKHHRQMDMGVIIDDLL